MPGQGRLVALQLMLRGCSAAELAQTARAIEAWQRVDFLTRLPRDLAVRVLSFLDATTLGRVCLVSRAWNALGSDDAVWKRMCIQHIGHRCAKCGWGLPSLSMRTIQMYKEANQSLRFKDLYRDKHVIARNWKTGKYYLRTLTGHEDGVMCVQMNDQRVVSGSYDCTIRVWDVGTLDCLKVLRVRIFLTYLDRSDDGRSGPHALRSMPSI